MKNAKSAMVRTAQWAAAAWLAFFLMSLTAFAGSSETKLAISATILKHASLSVLAQPAAVVVTATDIARGYVDVSAPAHIAVQSNTFGGYMLEFANQGNFMRQILVKGLGSDVQLGPAGGIVTLRSSGSGMTKTTLALGFRFLLAESAQQGTYAWPMHFSVTPL